MLYNTDIMKPLQTPTAWFVSLVLILSTLTGLTPANRVEASSNRFSLTEIADDFDPDNNYSPDRWQYQVQASTTPGAVASWHDSPWHWRHWDSSQCDDVSDLFPADPASPDTDISANGQTVTVNIYQEIDTVWVCFALECDDGSYAFARIKNLQTEAAATSSGCGGEVRGYIAPDSIGEEKTDILPTQTESNTEQIETINGGTGGGPGDQPPKLSATGQICSVGASLDPFGNCKAPAPSLSVKLL